MAAEGIKAPEILRRLEQTAKAEGWTDPLPSERTLRSIYKKAQGQSPDERREQGRFRWPQSIEDLHALPWSSSRAALDLVKFREQTGGSPRTIREAKWFARLRQASQSLPDAIGSQFAAEMASDEFAAAVGLGTPQGNYGLEVCLTYQPWRSQEDRQAFDDVADRHHMPSWHGYPSTGGGLMLDSKAIDYKSLCDYYQQRTGGRAGQMLVEMLQESLTNLADEEASKSC
jgi:hypothetical protein